MPCASSLPFVSFRNVVAELDCAAAVEAAVSGFVLECGTVGVWGHTGAEARYEAFAGGGCGGKGTEEGQGGRLRDCHYRNSPMDSVRRRQKRATNGYGRSQQRAGSCQCSRLASCL